MDFLENRPFIKFVLLFSIIYSGFLLLNEISAVKKLHHGFFASVGEWVYNSWHPDIRADISTDVVGMGASASNDYVLSAFDKIEYRQTKLHNSSNPTSQKQFQPIAFMAFKSRMSHAIATFFLLSLVLATPNKWKRKLIGAFIAIYILYILVAMKLTFLLQMADGSKTGDDGTWYFFSSIIGNNESYQELYYILLLGIWMLVSISKDSISKLTSFD